MPPTTTRENKGYKPRACYFIRTFHIMAKSCGSTICSDNKEHNFCLLVCCLLPPSSKLNVFLTCDIAIWLWIFNVCTAYNREWCYLLPRVLHYPTHSREQYYKLNCKHTRSYLQCKAQGFSILQIPLMKSIQISPLACFSKIMIKHPFIITCPSQKTNNYQFLMTCLWRLWTYKTYKSKIIVWLEAWLNQFFDQKFIFQMKHTGFFHTTDKLIVQVRL